MQISEEMNNVLRTRAIQRLTEQVLQTYNDEALLLEYNSIRSRYDVKKEVKQGFRLKWQPPNGAVAFFLKQIFEPHYGPQWAFNKNVLKHEYVRPWLLIPCSAI